MKSLCKILIRRCGIKVKPLIPTAKIFRMNFLITIQMANKLLPDCNILLAFSIIFTIANQIACQSTENKHFNITLKKYVRNLVKNQFVWFISCSHKIILRTKTRCFLSHHCTFFHYFIPVVKRFCIWNSRPKWFPV